MMTVTVSPPARSPAIAGIAVPDWMEGMDVSHLRRGQKGSEPDSAYLQNVVPTGHADSINTPYRGLVTRDGWIKRVRELKDPNQTRTREGDEVAFLPPVSGG